MSKYKNKRLATLTFNCAPKDVDFMTRELSDIGWCLDSNLREITNNGNVKVAMIKCIEDENKAGNITGLYEI